MLSRKYSCENTKPADKRGYILQCKTGQSVIEESIIEVFECTDTSIYDTIYR